MTSDFTSPPDGCRPFQFVPAFEDWCGTTREAMLPALRRMWDAGIRGLVVSVNWKNYMRDPAAWEALHLGVRTAHEMGYRIWIYDEEGYPSGAAGTLVLERYPQGEAQGLVRHMDPDGTPRYEVIRLYEGTHATENFYAKRPYVNILDPTAVSTFVEVTHERYASILHPIATYVEAFFTDEPSLIACYVPSGKDYPPTLPWHPRIPEEFVARKGYDLTPHMESLFHNVSDIDRKVRCDFYEVVSALCAETYFGTIQRWCHEHGIASSGHLLGEETMFWQTMFEGNPFPCYSRFDIPGIDMIVSDPERIMREKFFLVPKLAGSAARIAGKQRVMCEISDFLGVFEKQPASAQQAKCTAGILYSMGVTDLVSMYPSPAAPPPLDAANEAQTAPVSIDDQLRDYADHTARLYALFRQGRMTPRLAVLHPLLSVWAHFAPSHRSMYEPHPDPTVQCIDDDFADLCRGLLQRQVDFDIIDEQVIADAGIAGTELATGTGRYDVLILPSMDTIRLRTLEKVNEFVQGGGTVLMHSLAPQFAADGPEHDPQVLRLMQSLRDATKNTAPPHSNDAMTATLPHPVCRLGPPSPHILAARLQTDEKALFFLTNTCGQAYDGHCTFDAAGIPFLLSPEDGSEHRATTISIDARTTTIALRLKPYHSTFIEFRS